MDDAKAGIGNINPREIDIATETLNPTPQAEDKQIRIKDTDLENTMNNMSIDKRSVTIDQELSLLQTEVNKKLPSNNSTNEALEPPNTNKNPPYTTAFENPSSVKNHSFNNKIDATKQKEANKLYKITEYLDQPKTSAKFVSYVKAGENGNEIIGGLVKNGPYKGQYLFTAGTNFTGTIVIPEYNHLKQNNSVIYYPPESITFLNGKVTDINNSKPSRLRIHRAHLKEERNNHFQRNKSHINQFFIKNAQNHNQKIFFLVDFKDSKNIPIEKSPHYIIALDQKSHHNFLQQQKSFLDKIPIVNNIFKYNYEKRLINTPENLANYFVQHPENFNITLRALNKNDKTIEISLSNLYSYNDSFYKKIEQSLSSPSTGSDLHKHPIQEEQPSKPVTSIHQDEQVAKDIAAQQSKTSDLTKVMLGLLPSAGLTAIATTIIATDGIILPVTSILLSTTIIANRQLLPNSFQLLKEGLSNIMNYSKNPNYNNNSYLEPHADNIPIPYVAETNISDHKIIKNSSNIKETTENTIDSTNKASFTNRLSKSNPQNNKGTERN